MFGLVLPQFYVEGSSEMSKFRDELPEDAIQT